MFSTFETSQESGQPVELYEFRMGSEAFLFTSDEQDVTLTAIVYAAVAARREATRQAADATQEALNVYLPSDLAFVRRFVLVTPGKRVSFTLKRFHRNDPDLQVVTFFRGTVQSFKFTRDGREVVLQILPPTAAYSRNMPRFTYQGICNHQLYDSRCGLDEFSPAFSKFLLVTAVSGSTLTASGAGAFGADFFEAGFVEMSGDFRAIVKQTADVLELIAPFSVSPFGQTLRFVAGCKHRLITDCLTKFNNVSRYGGFPWTPTKNPFEGLD